MTHAETWALAVILVPLLAAVVVSLLASGGKRRRAPSRGADGPRRHDQRGHIG